MNDEVTIYQSQVWSDTPAAFLRSRGLVHSTVDRFKLGFVGEPVSRRDHKRRGCLVLPYEDGLGRTRTLRYRPLYPTDAKYLTAAGERAHVFAVRAADNPVVYITEGEFDAMSLWQVGLKAVGIPGAQVWKDEWRWLFRNCERVVLCFDPDPAGMRGALRIYQGLQYVTDVDVATLPPGMDCNDVLVKLGANVLREVVG